MFLSGLGVTFVLCTGAPRCDRLYLKATCLPFVVLLPGMNGTLISFVNMVVLKKNFLPLYLTHLYFVTLRSEEASFVGWVCVLFLFLTSCHESVAP